MAVKFNKANKEIKDNSSKGGKLCTLSLIFTIVFSIVLGGFALAPFLSGFFGVVLFFVFVTLAILGTGVTLGIGWTNEGFRNFFKSFWTSIGNIFAGTAKIKPTLKPYIVYIALGLLALSAAGFIYNLIFFIKHKSNKGRFIASCIFFGLTIINFIIALGVYLS